MTSPPTAAWERIRSLLSSEDAAHHAQAVELLAALGDPWLYDQAIGLIKTRPAVTAGLWDTRLEGPLVCLDPLWIKPTRRRYRIVGQLAALRMLGDAPGGVGLPHDLLALQVERSSYDDVKPTFDLEPLRAFPRLRWLELEGAEAVIHPRALEALRELSRLALGRIEQGLAPLRALRLERLEELAVANSGDLPPLSWPRVRWLHLDSRAGIEPSLAAAASLPSLRKLSVDAAFAAEQLAPLAALPELESLRLRPGQKGAAEGWAQVPWPPALRSLDISLSEGAIDHLAASRRLSQLEDLSLSESSSDRRFNPRSPSAGHAPRPCDLSPLRHLPRLRRLKLLLGPELAEIRLDAAVAGIEELEVGLVEPFALDEEKEARDLANWDFLARFPALRRIVLTDGQRDQPGLWAQLRRSPRLEELWIRRCDPELRPTNELAERVRIER